MQYLLDRLSETSTWRGITLLLTAFGVNIAPELQGHIITAGLGTVGIINVFRKEKK
jgi:hypothetical protein